MDKVFLIANRELQSFFSTWMGYIIAAAALFIDGLLFVSMAANGTKFSEQVMVDFFYFSSGIAMAAGLFLAMRLFAEERQTGTLNLFYTSPVSERQIVYGKFLSAFFVFLVLLLLSVYLPLLIKLEGKVSYGHMAAGYLGCSLLGSAVISIGLFASVLAPNQLIAGIVGAALTVTALVLWMVSDVVGEPFRSLFQYLAIHNRHFNPFSNGLIHTKDVVFYVSAIVLFLECSVRYLQTRRWQGQ